jgi:hypothetical protein
VSKLGERTGGCPACQVRAEQQVILADVRRTYESLSKSDAQLLEQCREPQNVDNLDVEPHDVMWLHYFGLIGMTVDKADRVWIQATEAGVEMARRRVA